MNHGFLRCVVLFLVACGCPLINGQCFAQSTRQQEIETLQKQIDALRAKADALRKEQAKPKPTSPSDAKSPGAIDQSWSKQFTWRCLGPGSMGGRIVAISVYEADPTVYWVATASGGLLKTENNGTTFEHQFDKEATVSIGDVCVAPSDKNIVWVGTGENNPRNSVSYGDGVYKSTDSGKTWKNMGLKKSFQTGKILIHPKDPNTVYVGALGRLYGPNEERGLYKTTDGGATWQRILYVDDKTGVIDMRMHPRDPNTLLIATWERRRDGYDTHPGSPSTMPEGYDSYDPFVKWGPGSGIYKTTDGGESFRKLTSGLPGSPMGRIGLDYYLKDPNIVFAIIDCERIGMTNAEDVYLGIVGVDSDAGAKLTEIVKGAPAEIAGLKVGDIVLSVDGKTVTSYEKFTEAFGDKKIGEKILLRISRNREVQEISVTLGKRPASSGASTNRRPFSFAYGGQRENVQNRQGPGGNQLGGVYRSADGGESWTRVNSLNPRPMYFSQVRIDPTDEKNIYVLGISMYRSADGGKTFRVEGNNELHPDQHCLWIDPKDGRHMILGCDGGFYQTFDRMANWDHLSHVAIGQFYHVAVDNKWPYNVYGGLQDNGSWGGPSQLLRRSMFGGAPRGPINEDWILLGGGDGFVCRVDPNNQDIVYWEYQDGNMFRYNLKTGQQQSIRPRPVEAAPRIDWSRPVFISLAQLPLMPIPQISRGNLRYKFNWNTPYVLSHHNSQIFYAAGNYVFRSVKQGDNLRPISPEITLTPDGTATALAESPRNQDVLWVGTDDGALWVSRDAGANWTNLTEKIGLPGRRWVASIEPSRYVDGRCYVTFDAHRSNDDEPYVYVTEDFGQTWKSLRANLPWGSTRVLREDVENANVLYCGTEFAIWVSTNRGLAWSKLNNNLPTVAIHEIAQQAATGDLVVATHGRSLWACNVTALRQFTADAIAAKATLYRPATVIKWRAEPERFTPYGSGSRRFFATNPPPGVLIYYSLAKKAEKINLKILDAQGKLIQELHSPAEPGLHTSPWYLVRSSSPTTASQRPSQGPQVPTGTYRAVLTVDGSEQSQLLKIDPDPTLAPAQSSPGSEAPTGDR